MSNTAIQKRENTAARAPERTEQAVYYTPLVDIVETAEAFLFEADLPGVKAGDVDVNFANGMLTIDAKAHPRQKPDQAYAWQEYGVGHFHRTFTINTPIDPNAIKAELKNGVLKLYVPKAESAKTRKIQIQTS